MTTTNFLADTFDPETFLFSKPKKYKNAEIMVCKIKNKNNDPVLVQFPKMTIASDYTKFVELDFTSETGYNKKVHTFLVSLDTFVMGYICQHSEQWFGKLIPMENVKDMYIPSQPNTMKFIFDKVKSEVINKRNEKVELSEIIKGVTLECISQLKFIVFTKDTCFLQWEICTAKVHKKIARVPRFGFVDDPDDESETEESDEEIVTFF